MSVDMVVASIHLVSGRAVSLRKLLPDFKDFSVSSL